MNVGTLEIKLLANIARLQTDMDKANQTVDRAMKGINKSVGIAKNAFVGLSSVFGAAQILRMADDYKKFDAQLKLSTRTTQEYVAAYKDVIRISRQSQSDIAAVGVLYARLTNNLRDFGTSQKEISKIAESVSLSLRVSNATVQETNSVMLQLSQSFGSGRINGQEFLAVSEGAPIIMRQLAKSLGTTVGALKDMSAAGQLTADVLAKALSDPAYLASLREQVKEVGTMSSAWTVLLNNLKVYVGEADKANGASDVIRKGIILVADSLDYLVTAGLAVAAVAFGRMTTATYESVKAQVASASAAQAAAAQKVVLARNAVTLAEATYRSAAATGASTLSLNNNAAATTNAARAAAALTAAQSRLAASSASAGLIMRGMGTALAFMGGPLGIAIAGIVLFGDKIVEWINKTRGMTPALQEINKELERQNKIRSMGLSIKDPMVEEKSRVIELQREIDKLSKSRSRYQELAKNPSLATVSERITLDFGGTGDIAAAAARAARVEQDKLRIAYDKLQESQEKVTDTTKQQVISFAQLTEDLKLASIQAAEYEKQSKAIIEAGKREGKSQAEISEALGALKKKLLTEQTKATKDLTDAEKELQRIRENQAKADVELLELRAVNDLLRQGVELEEARFRVESLRAGLRPEQIESLLRERGIQGDLLEIETARQDRIKLWIKEQEEMREKELERIKDVAKANEKASEDYLKSVEKAEEEKRKAFEKTVDSINNIFREGFANLVNGGKSTWKSFTKSLLTTFKTALVDQIYKLLAQPFVIKLIASILGVGGVGGATGAAASGLQALSGGGGGGSLIGTLKQGFDSLNTNVIGSIEKLGVFLSNGQGGLGDAIGGFLGQNASMIAGALAFAPAALSLLQGDVKSAAFQGAGAAIGFAFGGPVGAALGSVLGGFVGGLFGGKKQPPRTITPIPEVSSQFSGILSNVLTTFGGAGNVTSSGRYAGREGGSGYGFLTTSFDGQSSKFSKRYKDAYGEATMKEFIEKDLPEFLKQVILRSSIPGAFKDLFRKINGLQEIAGLTQASANLNSVQRQLADTFGVTTIEAAQVANATGLAGQALVDFVNKLASAGMMYKTVGQILMEAKAQLTTAYGSELPATLKSFDAALKSIDTTTQAGINTFAKLFQLRDQFIEFQGAIDSLKGNVSSAIFSMLSESEQMALKRQDMARMFTELGFAVPQSITQLIEMGRAIDFNTEAGLNLAAVFPTLVAAFNAVNGAAGQLNDTLDPNNFRTLTDFLRAQNYQTNNIPLSMLPSYDVGTSYVPQTGPALIHQGERILTAAENQNFSMNSQAVVVALNRMEMRLQNIETSSRNSEINNKKTADTLIQVTRGGDAMLTEAAA